MFPYLTLHDATQTRNKNLLISHCYLTLELHTLLSPILVTITRSSHWNTKQSVFGLRCQMCSLFADKEPRHRMGGWHDITHHSRARPLSRWLVVTWLPGPAPPGQPSLVTHGTQTTDPGPSHHIHIIWSIVFNPHWWFINWDTTCLYFCPEILLDS